MKFQLKNVGKIKDAEFELKPLTVFIGANGSGKTYAASALWAAVTNLDEKIKRLRRVNNFTNQILELKSILVITKKIEKELKKLEDIKAKVSLSFTQKEIDIIYNYILGFLAESFDEILAETFKFNGFENTQFIFPNQLNKLDIEIYWTQTTFLRNLSTSSKKEQLDLTLSYRSSNQKHEFIIETGLKRSDILDDKNILNDFFIPLMYQLIAHEIYLSAFNAKKLIYIPAARTGLMFITHEIVQKQLESIDNFSFGKDSNQSNNHNDLTAPLNDFIAKIHNASRPKSELNTENQSFNQIMGGKLVQREGQYRFDFQPNGLEQTVPLSASSSLVTELAALSALEENIGYGTFIILEEPEAHLHLSAQREMAKLIVRLINEKGCRILLTTHSDTFLQQINNLIMLEKLSHHNENALADFGIQAAEVIAADDVAVYDFQCVGNETHVENLVCGEYGFVAKSMNDVLIALAKETQSIIEQIDDLEAE